MSDSFPKTAPFVWTHARTEAALLVAEDALSDEEIAAKVGITRRTLTTWKQHPAFRQRRDEKIAEFDAAVSRFPIAKRGYRLRILDQLHRGQLDLLEARATAYVGKVPGGETGLMIPQTKIGGGGEDGPVVVTDWVRDDVTPEIRALHKQAAQELGQWDEKSTIKHQGGIRREYVLITESGAGAGDVTDEATFAEQAEAIALLETLEGRSPMPEEQP